MQRELSNEKESFGATLASKSLRILPYLSRNFIYYSIQADKMNCKFEFKECSLLHLVNYCTLFRKTSGVTAVTTVVHRL